MYSSSGSSRYLSVRSAAIDTRFSENAPSCSPKKLYESQYLHNAAKEGKYHTPPNHNSESLDILQIQRLGIILILPTIRRPKIAPLDTDRPTPLSPEIKFPAYGALLPAIRALGENLILQRKRVELAICAVDNQFDSVVRREIPRSVFASSALRCESGSTKGLDIEGSVELGDQ